MLQSRPVLVPLHCTQCGRPVTIEYVPDMSTEQIDPPVWHCPVCDFENLLLGARAIVGVRLRLGRQRP